MATLFFKNEIDAVSVADQLYNTVVSGTTIETKDAIAATTAAKLIGLDFKKDFCLDGSLCNLPFPAEERECRSEASPQIYVMCCSAYNSGLLHGFWIDLNQDEEEIQDDVQWMLSWSPMRHLEICEGWMIADSMNVPFEIGEYDNICMIKKQLALHEEFGKELFLFCDNFGLYPWDSESIELFQDNFQGIYKSEQDFAEELLESMGIFSQLRKLPFNLEYYLDIEAIARDLIDDYIFLRVGFEEVLVISRF